MKGPSVSRLVGVRPVLSALAVLALILLVLGLPVNDFFRFLLLTVAVMAVCFGRVRSEPRRWLIALAIAFAVATAHWMLPGPQIEEGHNVYLPVGGSLEVFERELPPGAERLMRSIFEHAYPDSDKASELPDWWQDPRFRSPRFVVARAFAPSADALWRTPKYSRTVDAVAFHSQDEARIDAINRKAYNFHPPSKKARHLTHDFYATTEIKRGAMPFFVMVDINPALVGGQICWRGDLLWEERPGEFSLSNKVDRSCRAVAEQDLGRRVFALAIDPDKPRDFTVTPNLQQRLALWTKLALSSVGVLAILISLVSVDTAGQLLLPIGAVLSTLLTTLLYWPSVLSGFRTQDGGNDGLTHESLGFGISQAAARGDFWHAFQGGEDVFFYMPGMRYLRGLEDFLFGSTSFGVVLCTMFVPIFLYFLMRKLLPLRWSVVLIVTFLFIPLFERFGFAQFLYVREMCKGFPEPMGYGAFLGALALIAQHLPSKTAPAANSQMPTAWIGLALALSVALRPNLAVACALLLAMLGIWLLAERRWRELLLLTLGFAPILLIPFHNWYFGERLVPLTSAAFNPTNLVTPPSTYWSALGEIFRMDWAGPNLARVGRHFGNWNQLPDVYRLPALFATFWVLLRRGYAIPLKGLAAVALSMQAVLLFYLPTGRYAYLAWLLVFLMFVVVVREGLLPWLAQNYPGSSRRLACLPGLRQVSGVVASSRWFHAHQLNQVTSPMGFITGLKTVCRPLVSPLGQVLQLLPRGSRVFDIGCGSGGLLHLALSDAGVSRAAGYDVSTKAVRAAQTLPWSAEQLHVLHRTLNEGVPDIADADYVTLCDVLHHVPPEAKAPFLKDITEKMRPGAMLIVADIDASRRGGSWMNQLHDLVVSQEWVAPVAAPVARSMLQQAGMIVREESFVRSLWYPHYLILAEKPPLGSAALAAANVSAAPC
jgi:2-polyprenyl-3-methyl-5-hydroxy-6-metoxy-1,4-benzoquinol methylase